MLSVLTSVFLLQRTNPDLLVAQIQNSYGELLLITALAVNSECAYVTSGKH